ncbi:MAG: site-specific DNA-methyltransferase [Desulfobacterales bacterium]|nr:site-specific DNA-methyltransferase [Desulfobacterales bacterium]
MKTLHKPIFSSSTTMGELDDASIDLVVTSPPYPMIEMWDGIFNGQDEKIETLLAQGKGNAAFEAMHAILDRVWAQCYRVLKPGRFACINIGDATRTLGGEFALYPNHARILSSALAIGFTCLPAVIWRKQTNAPNKFMGSGMLPAGAYVTLEHEYILILRKGGKRVFTGNEAPRRRKSALFWEERNQWFSDVWMDIKGSRQALGDKKTRSRSAAFPFELAHRLISMYSIQGDHVLDPFLGLGTTMAAAMAAGRNSVGYEIDPNLGTAIAQSAQAAVELGREMVARRLETHKEFIAQRETAKGPVKHFNTRYQFPVVTRQEKELELLRPRHMEQDQSLLVPEGFTMTYGS